jgi:hypothetical protein
VKGRVTLPAGMLLDGSYRIERVIASGGFGISYAADDIKLNTTEALKEYYPADFGERDAALSVRPKLSLARVSIAGPHGSPCRASRTGLLAQNENVRRLDAGLRR